MIVLCNAIVTIGEIQLADSCSPDVEKSCVVGIFLLAPLDR